MKFVDARKSAVCRCNVGFSKISPDKHVDVCVDSDEDRGSTPLASSLRSQRSGERGLSRRSLGEGGHNEVRHISCELRLGKPNQWQILPTSTSSKVRLILA